MKTCLLLLNLLWFSVLGTSVACAGEGIHADTHVDTHADANAPAADTLAEQLRHIETLQGNFTQTISADDGEVLQQSSGDFAFNNSGQYRWSTLTPFAQLLLGDRETLLLYDPDLEQLNRRRLSQAEQQTPLFLLSSQELSLADRYHVESISAGYRLRPKASDSNFISMELQFKAGIVHAISALDHLGQTTHIRLLNLQLNRPIATELFEFEVPPGTDIIDEG